MPSTDIIVQEEDFSIGKLSERARSNDASNGALVTFTGMVRELHQQESPLQSLFLEHYPGMTEKALSSIATQAREKWPIGNVVIYHRIGELTLNDNIVFVGVTSAHRVAAFEAAQFIMDYLKRDAPFWKKEITSEGENWVEQKQSDLDAANKWNSN
jgi:molybdopterin synthase catalytic subunit